MKRFLREWGPALVWAAIIFALSSRPTIPVPLESGIDKFAHFAAYAVLGLLLARGQFATGLSAVWVVLLGSLYGASDELHQSFVPGRSPDVMDWAADSLGVLFGVFLFHLWWRSRRGKPSLPREQALRP